MSFYLYSSSYVCVSELDMVQKGSCYRSSTLYWDSKCFTIYVQNIMEKIIFIINSTFFSVIQKCNRGKIQEIEILFNANFLLFVSINFYHLKKCSNIHFFAVFKLFYILKNTYIFIPAVLMCLRKRTNIAKSAGLV